MIQISPQMRILLVVEPVGFRNHSERLIIPSGAPATDQRLAFCGFLTFPTRNNQRP